jgi:hypothetical protein
MWFYDTSTGAAIGAARYGSFVGKGFFGILVVRLAMDEYGEHKDLHSSDHRSVIPYIHGAGKTVCCRAPLVKSSK